ncbi:hypothetical protein QA601_10380 [Chitinispirillales bacterium ANBcel5]|uniref:hypothetical protein n=1 Tax=Cellulosispirillum alkaliphilum TaxID=3039283 RepID=UPI002A5649F4|nr:hypothetical protein [Chitinispirillales bacterium ANBcel5]
MNLLYYITSHGFGHAVRTAAIANSFSPSVDITFRTNLPESFFREEMKRPYRLLPAEFDCGCVQLDGVSVDIDSTLKKYATIAKRNASLLQTEVQLCNEMKIDCIVSDITPFAFEVASCASIPSVAVSNFTWFDVYNDYCPQHPWFKRHLEKIKEQYSLATLLLSLYPSLNMGYFKQIKHVPVVGRVGENKRSKLSHFYNFDQQKKIGLIYTGNYGLENVRWKRLEQFKDWEFFGVYPISQAPQNFHLVKKRDFRYQDLSASADIILCKLGYGVTSESMLNGIPLVFLPRENFAEYPVLKKEVLSLGIGRELSTDSFLNLRWGEILKMAETKTEQKVASKNGAMVCAREIEQIAKR